MSPRAARWHRCCYAISIWEIERFAVIVIILLVALFGAFVLLTFIDRGWDRLFYPRLVLLIGLLALAVFTLVEKLSLAS
jgi:hypothetical protein